MRKTENLGLNKPDAEDFYDIEDFNKNADIIDEAVKKLKEEKLNANDGDSKDLTVSFNSNDILAPTELSQMPDALTSGEKHASILEKVSTVFRNVRYIIGLLGSTDISKEALGLGDSTLTGAVSAINESLESKIGYQVYKIPAKSSITIHLESNRIYLCANSTYYTRMISLIFCAYLSINAKFDLVPLKEFSISWIEDYLGLTITNNTEFEQGITVSKLSVTP